MAKRKGEYKVAWSYSWGFQESHNSSFAVGKGYLHNMSNSSLTCVPQNHAPKQLCLTSGSPRQFSSWPKASDLSLLLPPAPPPPLVLAVTFTFVLWVLLKWPLRTTMHCIKGLRTTNRGVLLLLKNAGNSARVGAENTALYRTHPGQLFWWSSASQIQRSFHQTSHEEEQRGK